MCKNKLIMNKLMLEKYLNFVNINLLNYLISWQTCIYSFGNTQELKLNFPLLLGKESNRIKMSKCLKAIYFKI